MSIGLEAVKRIESGGLILNPMSEIKPERINWLWKDMIAKRKLHVFAGDSGIGKTLILTSLSAIVSRGGIFPGCISPCEAGVVMFLSGEDGMGDTIVPRLMASGANMDRVIALNPMVEGELFDLSQNLDALEDQIHQHGNISLLIIDPVTAFCGGGFDNDSVTSVRSITTRLGDLAERTGTAVIALQHLTKSTQNRMKNRVLGSGAWVHGPRIVLGAIRDNENGSLFGKIKANITDTNGVYRFHLEVREIDCDGDFIEAHYVEWEEPHLFHDRLNDYEEGVEVPTRGEAGEKAYDLLRRILADGEWHKRQDVFDFCLAEGGISASTIRRAAVQLRAVTRRTKETPSYTEWMLPQSVHTRA